MREIYHELPPKVAMTPLVTAEMRSRIGSSTMCRTSCIGEVRADRFELPGQRGLAGEAEIGSCAGYADIQKAREQLCNANGQANDADEETCLELHALDVPYIEDAKVPRITNSDPLLVILHRDGPLVEDRSPRSHQEIDLSSPSTNTAIAGQWPMGTPTIGQQPMWPDPSIAVALDARTPPEPAN